MTNIALVGLGYWGPNLARNLAGCANAQLHTLCDLDPARLERFGRLYPQARRQTSYAAVLDDRDVDGVVIAAPVATHFWLASQALLAGKHVFVEKPLAQSSAQCRELIRLADEGHRVLMVGHVFLYNAAVQRVMEYMRSGVLGDIYYIYSQRLNLGIIRQDVNALWNFGPHDLSIICHWLDAAPESVSAWGFSYLQPGIEDVVFLTLGFPGGIGANVHISWLDPHKVRRMTVVGSEKMVVYDDASPDARITLYDKGVTKKRLEHHAAEGEDGRSLGRYESFGEFQLLLRAGDIVIPKLEFVEPLKVECQHFVDCITSGRQPLTDGHHGLRVVEVLEMAQKSLSDGGARVAQTTV